MNTEAHAAWGQELAAAYAHRSRELRPREQRVHFQERAAHFARRARQIQGIEPTPHGMTGLYDTTVNGWKIRT